MESQIGGEIRAKLVRAVVASLSKPALQLLITLLEKKQERSLSQKATFKKKFKGDSFFPP